MKILTLGSPETTYIFNQKINATYNGNYEVKKVREFYTISHLMSDYNEVSKFANTSKISNEYKEFLNWNFSKDGFWRKLQNFQPDILIFDLFSDVYFGNLILQSGNYVTYRKSIAKRQPQNTVKQTILDKNFFKDVVEHVHLFIKKVSQISPGTHIVLNRAKLPLKMSIDGVAQKKFDSEVFKLSIEKLNKYNDASEYLENLILNQEDLESIDFDKINDFTELNFITGNNWYYLYNQNYYTDTQTQIEKLAEQWGLGPTVTEFNECDDIPVTVGSDVVLLDMTPSGEADLSKLTLNVKMYDKVKQIIKNDYVLHGSVGTKFRFVKRRQLKGIYPKFKDLHYRVIPPKDKKNYGPNKLLVRMFSYPNHNAISIYKRNFQEDFQTLKKSVAKNTYILEIGDINLIAGSFYTNTANFPDYQNQISELIKYIANQYGIEPKRIVMYGASRGATGALLTGALNNYKIIVADPIIDGKAWFNMNDHHFTAGLRKVNLMDDFVSALENYTLPKEDALIIGDSKIGVTFLANMHLPSDKVSKIDVNMDIFEHSILNSKSVPIQLALINYLLIKEDISVRDTLADVPDGVVVEVKHLINKSVTLEEVQNFRIRKDDLAKHKVFNTDSIENFMLNKEDDFYQYWVRK